MMKESVLVFGFLTTIALLVNGAALSQLGPPPCLGCENEGSATPSYGATAYCSQSGTTGRGLGFTQQEAARYAIRDCVNRGGGSGCCRVTEVHDIP
jgi:hypothetical protein